MIWQDFVFMVGSAFSVFVLLPTLRDSMANVPLGTSLPSAVIGVVYGTTFATLGMPLSAIGAFTAGTMWSLIALLRSPHPFRTEMGALVEFCSESLDRSDGPSDRATREPETVDP